MQERLWRMEVRVAPDQLGEFIPAQSREERHEVHVRLLLRRSIVQQNGDDQN